ncbi:hypothetical protein Tco_1138104 [Tanacetum coccineum]
MNKLVKGNLVRGLPSKLFKNDQTCVAYQKGKQHKASSTKDETSGILKSFITGIENLVDHKVKVIRCDNRTDFKNEEMNQFCEKKGRDNYFLGSGPDWIFDIDALTRTMNYEPIIVETQSNDFAGTKASDNADPKSSQDDGSKTSSDDGKKVDKDPRKESKSNDQEKEDNVNSTNNVNVSNTYEVNTVGGKTSIELSVDPDMPELEDYSIFKDDEDVGAEADMNNLDITI